MKSLLFGYWLLGKPQGESGLGIPGHIGQLIFYWSIPGSTVLIWLMLPVMGLFSFVFVWLPLFVQIFCVWDGSD